MVQNSFFDIFCASQLDVLSIIVDRWGYLTISSI